jgi:hypothetical protein
MKNTLPATARDACFLDLKTEADSTVWEPQHTVTMCVRTSVHGHCRIGSQRSIRNLADGQLFVQSKRVGTMW